MKRSLMIAASLMALSASATQFGPSFIQPRNDGSNPPDAAKIVAEIQAAFEEMKTANNQRLTALESNQDVTALNAKIATLEDTIQKAENSLSELATKLAAGGVSNGQDPRIVDPTYTENFNNFFRTTSDGTVAPDVMNALRRSVDTEGGYLAPVEWDRTIVEAQVEISPLRQICTVKSVTGAGFSKLVNTKGTQGGWVGEGQARPQTNAANFQTMGFGWGELYAMPAATQTILDDSEINVEAWLADEVAETFTLLENSAFIAGDGENKPRGLLTYVPGGVNENRNPLGSVGVVNSGSAEGITSDAIITLTYKPTSRYMQNAKFIMNRATMSAIRLLTDGDGNYLWQPTYAAGQPSTLCGYPVIEVADMPDAVANSYPIAFGDFKAGYEIYDRKGVSLLRDPYTAKPFVLFYTTKRVGGACVDPNAYFAMKVAA